MKISPNIYGHEKNIIVGQVFRSCLELWCISIFLNSFSLENILKYYFLIFNIITTLKL
jgi:hypothetical protein